MTCPVIPGHTRIFSGLCTADCKDPTNVGSSCGPLQIEFNTVGGSKSPRLTDKHNLLAFCRPKSPSEKAKLSDRKVMLRIVAREQSKWSIVPASQNGTHLPLPAPLATIKLQKLCFYKSWKAQLNILSSKGLVFIFFALRTLCFWEGKIEAYSSIGLYSFASYGVVTWFPAPR